MTAKQQTERQRDFRDCVAQARWVGQLEENLYGVSTVSFEEYSKAENELMNRIRRYEKKYGLEDNA